MFLLHLSDHLVRKSLLSCLMLLFYMFSLLEFKRIFTAERRWIFVFLIRSFITSEMRRFSPCIDVLIFYANVYRSLLKVSTNSWTFRVSKFVSLFVVIERVALQRSILYLNSTFSVFEDIFLFSSVCREISFFEFKIKHSLRWGILNKSWM